MPCTVMASLYHSWNKVLQKLERGAGEDTHHLKQSFEKYFYAGDLS